MNKLIMAQHMIIISAILTALLSQTEANIKCEDPYVKVGSQCIYLSSHNPGERKSHRGAIKACRKRKGFLAELIDIDEQRELTEFIREKYPSGIPLDSDWNSTRFGDKTGMRGSDWWVGGKKNKSGAWIWDKSRLQVDGEWQKGEPARNVDCLLMGRNTGKYYDYECEDPWQYICEWIPESVCVGKKCKENEVCVPTGFNKTVCSNSMKYFAHSSLVLLLLSLLYILPIISIN